MDRIRRRDAGDDRCRPTVRGERVLPGNGHGTPDARRQGRPDLRGHQPDPSRDRRRRGPPARGRRLTPATTSARDAPSPRTADTSGAAYPRRMHQPNGETFIVSAARTPIGKFGGALSGVPATTLGGVAIKAAVERAGLDPSTAQLDDVLMGQVLQAGSGQAPARQAALQAGLPDTTSAPTVNRGCGSGVKAVHLAAAASKDGD